MHDWTLQLQEPPADAGEAEMLLFALNRTRRQLAWKCADLDAAGLRQAHPPSTVTLGGLLKHLALVESHYTAVALTGEPMGEPWDGVDPSEWPGWEWRSAADDDPDDLRELWAAAVARTDRAIADALSKGTLDQLSKLTTASGDAVNVRRVLVDLHEEYARHVGHADLLREAVDGLVGEDPPRP